jgi:hypothetical protein
MRAAPNISFGAKISVERNTAPLTVLHFEGFGDNTDPIVQVRPHTTPPQPRLNPEPHVDTTLLYCVVGSVQGGGAADQLDQLLVTG